MVALVLHSVVVAQAEATTEAMVLARTVVLVEVPVDTHTNLSPVSLEHITSPSAPAAREVLREQAEQQAAPVAPEDSWYACTPP